MFGLSKIVVLFALALSSAQGAPVHTHNKRIAQVITAATQKWEAACLAAGGGQKCNPLSVAAFSTLLAAPGPCEQQNAADKMIDLAKQLQNNTQLIKLAQIFAQQPRNTPSSESVPYCQQAPKNSELSGLFQCQFAGAKTQTFVGGVKAGSPGTIPFGRTAAVNPPGSCPANPNGAIPDGKQLVDITQNPGVGANPKPNQPTQSPAPKPTAKPPPVRVNPNQPPQAPAPKPSQSPPPAAAKPKQPKKAAPKPTQGCTPVGAKPKQPPKQAPAPKPTQNPPAMGANPNQPPKQSPSPKPTASPPPVRVNPNQPPKQAPAPKPTSNTPAPAPAPGNFKLQNGKDAQKLNAKFATLTANSSCTAGENACVAGAFAQCVGGKFVSTPCSATLVCAALPLVNKAGTSITCTTKEDAITRIGNTGATGGLTGSG